MSDIDAVPLKELVRDANRPITAADRHAILDLIEALEIAPASAVVPDSLIRRFVAALLTNDTEGSADIVKAMVDYVIPVAPTAEQTDHIAGERKMVVGEWQPIETAPKTGRTLLLGYPNILRKWRTTRGQWMSEAYIAEYWEEPDDAEAGWYETSVEAEDIPSCWPVTPTHWMPLPAAPASSTGDQEVGS